MGRRTCRGTTRPGDLLASPIKVSPDVAGRCHPKPVPSGGENQHTDPGTKLHVFSLDDLAGGRGSGQDCRARDGSDACKQFRKIVPVSSEDDNECRRLTSKGCNRCARSLLSCLQRLLRPAHTNSRTYSH